VAANWLLLSAPMLTTAKVRSPSLPSGSMPSLTPHAFANMTGIFTTASTVLKFGLYFNS
jgi:hypothetical protein